MRKGGVRRRSGLGVNDGHQRSWLGKRMVDTRVQLARQGFYDAAA
jgi:hypothetical protein